MKTLFHDIKNVAPDYRIMLLMMLFMKAGQFMVLPFIAIFLAAQGTFSPTAIGLVVGSGPFVYAVAGLFAGVFSDRFSPKTTMVFAQIMGGISIFFFFSFHSLAWYFFANVMTGLSRVFFDIGSKSYKISGLSLQERRLRFNLRYMIINSAAALGPACGAYFAAIHSYVSFQIIGVLYLLLGILAVFVLHKSDHEALHQQTKEVTHLFDAWHLLLRNRQVQTLALIAFVFWGAYSQIDSTLPQYLHAHVSGGVKIYSWMLITNAVGCALVPLFLQHWTKNMALPLQGLIGTSLFALSYLVMSFVIAPFALLGAMSILVLGESLVLPLNDLILSSISPTQQVGKYYGAMSISSIGLGLGPVLGGFIYEHFNFALTLCIYALSCLMTIPLYKKIVAQMN